MLYLIGLGLADEKDISVKGLEIVKRAERVYLEAYTAILLVEKEQLVRPVLLEFLCFLKAPNVLTRACTQKVGSILWTPSHCRRP
jgi:hypothetical protein